MLRFEGPGAAKIRAALVLSLQQHAVTIVDLTELASAAEKLGSDLHDARPALSRTYAVDAWVEGNVERDGRDQVVTFTIADGATGESLDTSSLNARNPKALAKLVRSAGHDTLAPSIARGQRATAAPPEPVPEAEAEPEPKAAAKPRVRRVEPDDEVDDAEDDSQRPSPLRLELGIGGFARALDYRENLDHLPGYDIALPPALHGFLVWYPAAHFSSAWPAHLGLRVRGQYAFGISSAVEGAAGPDFSTSSHVLELGLRGRLPLDPFELGIAASYGMHDYAIEAAKGGAATVEPGVPSAGYRYLLVDAELRMTLGDVELSFGGGILPLLAAGDIEDWFPRASGLGLEGSLGLGYAIGPSFDLFALVALRRYAVSFDPRIADVDGGLPIVGGMIDQYTSLQLGLRFSPGAAR